ncbi:nitrate reductase molybdenum cofactor assembly chaperone [Azorhizobium oxalatiphilum]|uniref:Nitrate reductase molybdenum cofactor assembly chaperone n=1 Tax=Azorhizobium oxalatiphilum TaxID=980631 RepID=A0A917F5P5_9HYPH|nr:nitrate reductase molybdenum cofactor assembly chaperone [Azorhizobium oxalatiphilum]GGF52331.1 nitrate reductase molybdenum cofactor assembly chaperone [Azorhizobium oxalatiphilum]
MAIETLAFKALSALLTYPDAALVAAVPEIAAALAADDLVDTAARDALAPLLEGLRTRDLYDLQADYVELFDRSRKLSLHLFEHVHGESRDRGQAMVDLAALYEGGGLNLSANELPDYLPLFLEYLATRPLDEARGLLADTDHILALLEERLGGRSSPYAAVFSAVRAAGGVASSTALPQEDTAPLSAADELKALDAAWEETAVAFGPGEALGGCSVDRLRTQIRAAQRDARLATA